MSVCTEITSDSSADSPRRHGSKSMENKDSNENARSKSPTFIVTDPDSDIETDAVPSAPRSRGTPIPGPPKPHIVEDEEPSTNGEIPGKTFPESHPNTGKIPPGFFKNKTPGSGDRILMSSTKPVNDQHLDCVADNIGEKWKDLGLYLQMKKAAIYRFEHDYKNDHRERVYQLLLEWKQGTGGPHQAPLLARLSNVLWQLRERDALDSLVKLEKDPRLNGQ